MLSDKTQFFNRLENSNITVKSNPFGQVIKNPYLAQYKIFEERLKNPKTKAMSMIMRKRRNQQKIGKENLQNEIRHFEQEECLKEARKVINKEESKFTVFSNTIIDYDINENSKQSEVLTKFKEKLQELKYIKNQPHSNKGSRVLSVNLSHFSKYPRSEVGSVGSQRKKLSDLKPHTAEVFTNQRDRMRFMSHQSSKDNVAQNRLKLPITFVAYKRNKSFAEKFTKDKK